MLRDREPKRRVFLTGFMGAGKTTVGKVLAQKLGWSFYDLDDLVEQREQRSVARIFDESGENAFRQLESSALAELLQRSEGGYVAALGGGAFVQADNRRLLEQAGAITILLRAPVEELQRRCQAGGASRPLAGNKDRFEQLFAARQQAYALCPLQVETLGKSADAVAEEIEKTILRDLDKR